MKSILNPGKYPENINLVLLILRLTVGIFMLTHGMGKMSKLFGEEEIKFADPIGLGASTSLALVVFAEVFCSILLILGLFTRFAALVLLINFIVIALIVHAKDKFGEMELPLLYAIIYLGLLLSGGGRNSIDYLIYNSINKK